MDIYLKSSDSGTHTHLLVHHAERASASSPSLTGRIDPWADSFVSQFLMISPKQRTDLIPYYGRLVATISRYAPDLGKELLKEVCHHVSLHFISCSCAHSRLYSLRNI